MLGSDNFLRLACPNQSDAETTARLRIGLFLGKNSKLAQICHYKSQGSEMLFCLQSTKHIKRRAFSSLSFWTRLHASILFVPPPPSSYVLFLRLGHVQGTRFRRVHVQEVAVMVAKTKGGEVVSFPVTETIHKDSILHVTQTPAQIPEELLEKAKELAEQAVASLEGKQIVQRVFSTLPHSRIS